MTTTAYNFTRNGAVVACLHANGMVLSNADGAGWLEWDDVGAFLEDAGVTPDPNQWLMQIATIVQGTPVAIMPEVVAAVEPTPATKPKRGRAKAGAGPAAAGATVDVAAQSTPTAVGAGPGPLPLPPVPNAAMGTLTPEVLAFMASQSKATAAVSAQPPAPALVPVPATNPMPVQLNLAANGVGDLLREHGVENVLAAIGEWSLAAAAQLHSLGFRKSAEHMAQTTVHITAAFNSSRAA